MERRADGLLAARPAALRAEDLGISPLATSETIPSAWYVDADFHAFDRKVVLERSWQYVGPASRVAEPGTFVSDIVAGNPVVAVRDRAGRLRAFYNVCKHRGGPLVTTPCGAARMLQCQYHGWTYRLDGMLRGVPRFDRTELFDKRDYGLTEIAVGIWEGLLFVCLRPDETPPLADIMQGIRERITGVDPAARVPAPGAADVLAPGAAADYTSREMPAKEKSAPESLAPESQAPNALYDLASFTYAARDVYAVKANWKVYVDNYLEGYHLPLVHPELCDLLDFSTYVTETFDWYSLQHSPIKAASKAYGAANEQAYYYFVFPNLMLNILPGRLQVNRVDQVASNACSVVFDYYYGQSTSSPGPNPGSESEGAEPKAPPATTHRTTGRTVVDRIPPDRIAADRAFSDRVQAEDIDICEHVQRGLQSNAYDRGRFSYDLEGGVHHFQSALKRAYRDELYAREAGELSVAAPPTRPE